MEYQSITHRFQLKIQKMSEFNLVRVKAETLLISEEDYFFYNDNYADYYGENPTGKPEYPRGEPKFPRNLKIPRNSTPEEIENLKEKSQQEWKLYWEELKRWKLQCITSNEERLSLKKIFTFFLTEAFSFREYYMKKYGVVEYIEPELLKQYLIIGKSADFNHESLENLILYQKMIRLCYNEEKYEQYKIKRKEEERKIEEREMERQDYQRFHEENYSWEDSYRDGGGGDEWSDPSEFW